ncbi:MAG: BatA domain-containing protein [Bacteroidota bacterium]
MTFLNPFILFGLAAAAIPILLHLLNLRKLKTIDFSTLRFLKELQKTSIRKLKAQQIILLILRTLIVIFSVLAFSRPTIKSTLPSIGTHAKSSIIVVLDNSLSMDITDEDGNRFSKAKKLTSEILGALEEGDEMAFIPLSSLIKNRKRSFSRNFAWLKEEIDHCSVNPATASLNDGLRAAQGLLDASLHVNKEIYILTDLQQQEIHSLELDSIKLFDDKTSVFLLPSLESKNSIDQNISIDTAIFISRVYAKDKPVELQTKLYNSSVSDAKGIIVSVLFNGERVAQRTVDIGAGSYVNVSLQGIPHTTGLIKGEIQIENDVLESDNHRYFSFIISSAPKVALIGNQLETDFISLSIAPHASLLKSYSANQSASVHFEDFDILILATTLSQTEMQRIDAYIQNGGSVLFFPSSTESIAVQQQFFSGMGLGPIIFQEFSESNPGICISADRQHPILQGVFKGFNSESGLGDSPKIIKALCTQAGQSIISMQGGSFLNEIRRGEGKVMYCAVPPSPAWSSFPFTGLMPTIIYRSAQYLSAKEVFTLEKTAGQEAIILIPTKSSASSIFTIKDPNGFESDMQAADLPGGMSLQFGKPDMTGVYGVFSKDKNPITSLIVNQSSQEGHLLYKSPQESLSALKKRLNHPESLLVLNKNESIANSVAKARIGTELWRFFILLALLCAITEMIVAKLAGRKASAVI